MNFFCAFRPQSHWNIGLNFFRSDSKATYSFNFVLLEEFGGSIKKVPVGRVFAEKLSKFELQQFIVFSAVLQKPKFESLLRFCSCLRSEVCCFLQKGKKKLRCRFVEFLNVVGCAFYVDVLSISTFQYNAFDSNFPCSLPVAGVNIIFFHLRRYFLFPLCYTYLTDYGWLLITGRIDQVG